MPLIGQSSTVSPMQFSDGGIQTAGFTAAPGASYQINLAASLGSVAIALPSAPAQGTVIAFSRIDTNFYTSFALITPGGSDTMDGGGANFNLSAGGILLVYQGTSWRVIGYGTGGYSGLGGITAAVGFPGNAVARDASGRSAFGDPVNIDQAATRNYVDTKAAVAVPSYAAYGASNILLGQFDKRRSVYNFKASNTRRLRTGLALAAAFQRTDHLIIGDSSSSGCISQVGTTLFDRPNAWPMAMRNALGGMGVPIGGSGLVRTVDYTYTDARYTTTGSWLSTSCYSYTAAVGATFTYTPSDGGDVVEFHYYDSSGATATLSVNGATSGSGFRTITMSGSAGWKRVRLTGQKVVANQTKIVMTCTVQGTSGVITRGVNIFTINGGLVVHNVAQSGSTASGTGVNSWLDMTSGPGIEEGDAAGVARTITDAAFTAGSPIMTSATSTFTVDNIGDQIDQNAPPTAGIVVPIGAFIDSINSTTSINMATIVNGVKVVANAYASASAQTVTQGRDPSCIHIALGANDQQASVTVPTIMSSITTIRNRYPNSDCILHLYQELNYSLISQVNQNAFASALYALADTLDVPLFDWRDRVGTFAQAQALGMYGDINAHFKAWAQSMTGSFLAEVIGESAGKTQGIYPVTQDTDLPPKKYVDDRTKSATNVSVASITTTTETVVLQVPIAANSLKVGSAYDYALSLKPAIASGTTVRVRIGVLGTIADAAVVTMSATVAQTSALARYCEGVGAITAIGASAAHSGVGSEAVHAIAPAVGSAGAITTAGTFDSTKDNILSVTVQNGTSTTTTMQAGRLELTL